MRPPNPTTTRRAFHAKLASVVLIALLLLQSFILPIELAFADHEQIVAQENANVTQIEIKFTDETITDASVQWERQEKFDGTKLYEEGDSGTLTWSDSHKAYVSDTIDVKGGTIQCLSSSGQNIINLEIVIGDVTGSNSINICSAQKNTNGIAQKTIDFEDSSGEGDQSNRFEITFVDPGWTGAINIVPGFYDSCELTYPRDSIIESCDNIARNNREDIAYKNDGIVFYDLEQGTYYFQATYDDECRGGSEGCNGAEGIRFNLTSTAFTVYADEENKNELEIEINISSTTADPEEDEEAESFICGGVTLGFFICPVISALLSGIQVFYRIIQSQLDVQPLILGANATENSEKLYEVWSGFRFIANLILVAIFLLLIIGQSLSWFLTSYEIKKIAPRLAIGVIASNLSWHIVAFVVDVFNTLGAGVKSILLQPVLNDPALQFDFFGWIGSNIVAGLIGTKGLTAVRAVGFIKTMGYLLPILMLPVIIFIFFSLALVAVRQILIMFLIVISPVIFALWALPGAERIVNGWWSTFLKALMIYPLIVGFIALGEMSAKIAVKASGDGSSLHLAAIVVFFAPYFLIPASFNIASGILATISGQMGGVRKNLDHKLFGSRFNRYNPHDDSWRARQARHKQISSDQKYTRQLRNYYDFKKGARGRAATTGAPMTDGNGNAVDSKRRIANGGAVPRRLLNRHRRMLAASGLEDADIERRMEIYKNGAGEGRGGKSKLRGLGATLFRGYAPQLLNNGTGFMGKARGVSSGLKALSGAPSAIFQNKFGPSWEMRLATETINAKKAMDLLTSFASDEYVLALFGDYDPTTGKRLDESAIAMAKRYRNNYAMMNAGLKYLFARAGSSERKQDIVNMFSSYNPYAKKEQRDDLGVTSKKKSAARGFSLAFEEYEKQKMGTWKGAIFGTQNLTRDSRFRDYKQEKRKVYLRDGDGNATGESYSPGKTVTEQDGSNSTREVEVLKPSFGKIKEVAFEDFLNEFNTNVPFHAHSRSAPDYFNAIVEISEHIHNIEDGIIQPEDHFWTNSVDENTGEWVRSIDQTKIQGIKDSLKIARNGFVENLNSATRLMSEGGDEGEDQRERSSSRRTEWRDDLMAEGGADSHELREAHGEEIDREISSYDRTANQAIIQALADNITSNRRGEPVAPGSATAQDQAVERLAEGIVKRRKIGDIVDGTRATFAPQTMQAIKGMIADLNWLDRPTV